MGHVSLEVDAGFTDLGNAPAPRHEAGKLRMPPSHPGNSLLPCCSTHQPMDRHVVPFSPMHHWSDHSIRIHTFTGVLALQIARLRHQEAEKAGETVRINPSTEGWRKGRPILTETTHTQDHLAEIFNLATRTPRKSWATHPPSPITAAASRLYSSVKLLRVEPVTVIADSRGPGPTSSASTEPGTLHLAMATPAQHLYSIKWSYAAMLFQTNGTPNRDKNNFAPVFHSCRLCPSLPRGKDGWFLNSGAPSALLEEVPDRRMPPA